MGFIGLLRTLEAMTRPPRMGHDVDSPLTVLSWAAELFPQHTSASNHAGTGAESAPSPTIVQSAPPPTVDGEGPASVRDIQPSPEAGRPTSELLTEAAVHLDYYLDRHETSITSCLNGRGFTRELRDRAATFEAIEE